MTVLIIEDEAAAARRLEKMVLDIEPDATIPGKPDSVESAVEWLSTHPAPDLILMDIHLADGSAFEIFRLTDILCPVIFTTAYDEYALKAFRVNSIDYLLKPVQAEMVASALSKLRSLRGTANIGEDLKKLIASIIQEKTYKTHFLLPLRGDRFIPLTVADIAFIYIDNGIVKSVTHEGRYFVMDSTLDELEEDLEPAAFFRANRQYIISREAIKEAELWFNSRLSITLKVTLPSRIIVSKARVAGFRNWFSGKR